MVPAMVPVVELFISAAAALKSWRFTRPSVELMFTVPPFDVAVLMTSPRMLMSSKLSTLMVPPLPPVVELSILVDIQPVPLIFFWMVRSSPLESRLMKPPVPVDLFSMLPPMRMSSPVPLEVTAMVPPLPPVVELFIANEVLLPLLLTATEPSVPVRTTVPPLPVALLLISPSTVRSSPATIFIVPPLPPAAELSISPRFVVPAASTWTSSLVEINCTIPPFPEAVFKIEPSTLTSPSVPPADKLTRPPLPPVVELLMAKVLFPSLRT